MIRRGLLGFTIAATLTLVPARSAQAASSNTRIFMITSTYGVIAGSLIGLASLAFYSSPGNHVRNVAMGASLGLYGGLLLGAYMVYFVDDGKPGQPSAPGATPPANPAAPSTDNPLGLTSSLDLRDHPKTLQWAPIVAVTPESKMIGVQFVY